MRDEEREALKNLVLEWDGIGGEVIYGPSCCAYALNELVNSFSAPDDGLREGLEDLTHQWITRELHFRKQGDCVRAETIQDCNDEIEELLTKTPDGWKPIADAPRDEEILAFNTVTGWYKTKYQNVEDAEWPCREWNGKTGIWYPQPTHFMRMPAPLRESQS